MGPVMVWRHDQHIGPGATAGAWAVAGAGGAVKTVGCFPSTKAWVPSGFERRMTRAPRTPASTRKTIGPSTVTGREPPEVAVGSPTD